MLDIDNKTLKFIERSREIHNDKYNYEKVIYVNNKTKVIINCPKHCDFEQIPSAHLRGQGCPICGGTIKLTTEEFIIKAKTLHGDKYDYSKVNYIGNKDKIKIYCKKHEEYFYQQPIIHISQKCGCPKCGFESTANYCRDSLEEFIQKAKEIHEDKYDYSKVSYINARTKVEIYCKKHKEYFKQRPYVHIGQKCGCPKCGAENSADLRSFSNEEYIEKVKKIHGERYGYDKLNYTTTHSKIDIYCKVHKIYFSQSASGHLAGRGCHICSSSHGERLVGKCLDKLNIKYITQYSTPGNVKYRYDFYLPDHNTFIEFHGIQHYQPVEFFGGTSAFDRQKIRDDIKREIVKAWKGKLIIIKYTVNSYEQILKLLKTKLSLLNIEI